MKAVQRKIELWKNGDVQKLLDEAKTLHEKLCRRNTENDESNDWVKNFTHKMGQGKVATATRSLAPEDEAADILSITDKTRQILKDKHPDAKPAHPEMKSPGDYIPRIPIVFYQRQRPS